MRPVICKFDDLKEIEMQVNTHIARTDALFDAAIVSSSDLCAAVAEELRVVTLNMVELLEYIKLQNRDRDAGL